MEKLDVIVKTAEGLGINPEGKSPEQLKQEILAEWIAKGITLDFCCPKCKNEIPDLPSCPFCGVPFVAEKKDSNIIQAPIPAAPKEPEKVQEVPVPSVIKEKKKRRIIKPRIDNKPLIEAADKLAEKYGMIIEHKKSLVSYYKRVEGTWNRKVIAIMFYKWEFTLAVCVVDLKPLKEKNWKPFPMKYIVGNRRGATRGFYTTTSFEEAVATIEQCFDLANKGKAYIRGNQEGMNLFSGGKAKNRPIKIIKPYKKNGEKRRKKIIKPDKRFKENRPQKK